MKNSIKFKLVCIFILVLLGCCILISTDIKNGNEYLYTTVLICTAICILFCIEYILIKKYLTEMITKLSDVIEGITSLGEEEMFSSTEDTILSKFQYQIIEISSMLKNQNKKLESEKENIKSLVSDISHQLKTPLSNIKLYTQILDYDKLKEEERETFIKSLKNQIDELEFLTENMIRISRLESGLIQIKKENNNIEKACLLAIKQIHMKAEVKKIDIIFFNECSNVIKYDLKWTAEAIFNILDNAVKYTQEYGKITINIISYEMFIRIDIMDTGIGIEEPELAAIFKRFYRGKGSEDIEGVGIGLYLARKIISSQNGYIKVKSIKGRGSTFSVFLPLEK